MAEHNVEVSTPGLEVRVEYVIVSERSDGATITSHDPPFASLEEAADRLAWNYRWQEANMRIESRVVTSTPLAPVPEFEAALAAAVERRSQVFADVEAARSNSGDGTRG